MSGIARRTAGHDVDSSPFAFGYQYEQTDRRRKYNEVSKIFSKPHNKCFITSLTYQQRQGLEM